MKKLVLLLWLVFTAQIHATDIFSVPVQFTTGSSIAITSGVPLTGTWDFSGATTLGLSAPTIALTGDVTGSGTSSITTHLANIPDLTTAPGSILFTNVAPPVAPAAGITKLFTSNVSKRFHDRDSTGATGTTIIGNSGVTNQFVTAIDPDTGIMTLAQPAFTNISGTIPLSQLATQSANTVVGNATGSSAPPTAVAPATARSSSLLNIDQKTAVGDANYTILSTDRTVVTSASLTASRTWTLPAANSVNAGQSLNILDTFGATNGLNNLSISRAGSDTIEPGALTSFGLASGGAKSSTTLVSDGSSKWYIAAFDPGVGATGKIIQFGANNSWIASVPTWPTTAGSSGARIYSNGTNFLTSTPALDQANPSNPTGTTSTTGVMMGLGNGVGGSDITPVVTGTVLVIISGDIFNASAIADGGKVQIRYGTGTAPINGAALTGTAAGGLVQYIASTTAGKSPFSCNAIVTGLTINTAVWLDVSLAAITAGTATIENVSVSAHEL